MAKYVTQKIVLEYAVDLAPARVDRDKGIIHNVKILGSVSENGRRYKKNAVQEAAGLYEGAMVFSNHPSPSEVKKTRNNEDLLGKVCNVHEANGELYGDLLLVKSHPLYERLMEAAEDPQKHDLFKLSHNADASLWTDKNGIQVIESIVKVRSVDVVTRGGTTKSLFESNEGQNMKTIKVRTLLETLAADKRLPKWKRSYLLEMDDDMIGDDPSMPEPEMSPEDDSTPADPMDALKAGFDAAIMGVAQDDTIDVKGKMAKIKDLLTAQEKLMSDSETPPPVTTEEGPEPEPDPEDDDKEEEMTESLAESLCNLAGIKPVKKITSVLVKTKKFADAVSVLEAFADIPANRKERPTSSAGNRTRTESVSESVPEDRAEFVKRLTGRLPSKN